MKILYIITKSNWGGAQRHVYDLATHFKKSGHDVVVALGGEGMLRDRLREAGITTRPIGNLSRDINIAKDGASLGSMWRIIREEKPDILHLHSPKAAGLGSFVGKILKVRKVIYTVHGWTFNEDRPFFQKLIIAFFSWLTMLFCTHVITISQKEFGQTKLFPLIGGKLRMVHLGIAAPVFFSTGSADMFFQNLISKAGLNEGKERKILIGTIAELHPNKGLIYTIEALEKLAAINSSFIFCIIGEGEQRAELEALVKEKNLTKNVLFAGYIPNAAEYLKGLSLFLLTSVKEGLPYVLLEAGYAGLPVIATHVGGIPEIIDDMESGILIQSKKSQEIFHALHFLIQHKNTQREYARNLQEKVRKDFNLERMFAGTSKVYAEIPPGKLLALMPPQTHS